MVNKRFLCVLLLVVLLMMAIAPLAFADEDDIPTEPEPTVEPTLEPTEEPEEERPFLTVPFEEYTVTEGLLLCTVTVLVLGSIIRIVWGWLCGF